MLERRAGADERGDQNEVAVSERRREPGKKKAKVLPEGTTRQWGKMQESSLWPMMPETVNEEQQHSMNQPEFLLDRPRPAATSLLRWMVRPCDCSAGIRGGVGVSESRVKLSSHCFLNKSRLSRATAGCCSLCFTHDSNVFPNDPFQPNTIPK